MLAQALFKDQKYDAYNIKQQELGLDKQTFITQMVPRDQSGPTFVTMYEPINGEGDVI